MIRSLSSKAYRITRLLGIDPLKTVETLRNLPWYWRDYRRLRAQRRTARHEFALGGLFPCLGERQQHCGEASGHYFHQDLLVARRVFEKRPRRHVDVGSRIDGFVAHVASFRKIDVFDIRPLGNEIPNVTFQQADLMNLDESLLGCTDSLSCLHTIEHFGLGRYGDPVEIDGFDKGLHNLGRLLEAGGTFYLSTPIGPQRIEFNAHRVFAVRFLVDYLRKDYTIERFSYVDDHGALHENVPLNEREIDRNYGCRLGCGIFELVAGG